MLCHELALLQVGWEVKDLGGISKFLREIKILVKGSRVCFGKVTNSEPTYQTREPTFWTDIRQEEAHIYKTIPFIQEI